MLIKRVSAVLGRVPVLLTLYGRNLSYFTRLGEVRKRVAYLALSGIYQVCHSLNKKEPTDIIDGFFHYDLNELSNSNVGCLWAAVALFNV